MTPPNVLNSIDLSNVESLKKEAEQQVEFCLSLANEYFKKSQFKSRWFLKNTLFKRPEIDFKVKGKKAGIANCTLWKLSFNLMLLKENRVEFIEQVVPHEMAHLIVYQLNPHAQPHGQEWQMVMVHVFSRPALRTHNFDVSSVMGRTFPYRCDCQQHQLSIRRHNQAKKGRQYICKLCRRTLIYNNEIAQ